MTRNPVRWNTALLVLAAIVILAAALALLLGPESPLQLFQQAALTPAGPQARQAPSTFDTDAQS